MTTATATDFETMRARVAEVVDRHPVVTSNEYTKWFAGGEATREDVRHLAVQFSVFSHMFIEAQLRKVIHAPTVEAYHSGKEILMNELGVVFRPHGEDAPEEFDPAKLGVSGSIDGSRFYNAGAHFEWLVDFGSKLGLRFEDMGKWHHATPATRFFCEELLRIYGSEDPWIAAGASYAVEHWAAAGFWKELIAGLEAFKERECPDLPLGFWDWHDRLEMQHVEHTEEELRETVMEPGFDAEKFLRGAAEMLDGVHAFWRGLDEDRIYARSRGNGAP
jgi:hypothetical protein